VSDLQSGQTTDARILLAFMWVATRNGQIKNFTSNSGPQHPTAHGASRSVLEMNGEVVEELNHMLHRLCRPPSIPLSFGLATVLPRRSVSRVSWASYFLGKCIRSLIDAPPLRPTARVTFPLRSSLTACARAGCGYHARLEGLYPSGSPMSCSQ
jgi:hypothetical protein